MHTSHDALWRPPGGPRPFLHPFPVESRWTNQITSFSLSRSLSFSLVTHSLPLASLCLPPPRSLRARSLCLSLFLSFAVVLSPRRSSSSLSLSSSFLLSPHYPTHNRTRERDGATSFALHYSTAAYIASWSAVSTLSIVHTETREGSHHSLPMTGRRFFHQIKPEDAYGC